MRLSQPSMPPWICLPRRVLSGAALPGPAAVVPDERAECVRDGTRGGVDRAGPAWRRGDNPRSCRGTRRPSATCRRPVSRLGARLALARRRGYRPSALAVERAIEAEANGSHFRFSLPGSCSLRPTSGFDVPLASAFRSPATTNFEPRTQQHEPKRAPGSVNGEDQSWM